jgi:deazaflavin-dependent oxidoreductase (nitroreductase family)
MTNAGEPVYDSPTKWVADHIHEYVESEGEKGHHWRGTNVLVLTTRGRKTGNLRRSALIYGRHGDSYVVVASKAGHPHHPAWYRNLVADPRVELQVGPEVLPATARPADGAERQELWAQMARIWPDYDNYQKRTDRQIPVVVLEPA